MVNNPFSAKIQINLPQKEEIETYLQFLTKEEPDFAKLCEIEIPVLAEKLVGLSQMNIKNLILRALRNQEPVTLKFVSQLKKEIIEKESLTSWNLLNPNGPWGMWPGMRLPNNGSGKMPSC